MCIEASALAQKSEHRVEACYKLQIKDNEASTTTAEEEILHIDCHHAIGDNAQDEREDQIKKDQAGRDAPGFHQTVPINL